MPDKKSIIFSVLMIAAFFMINHLFFPSKESSPPLSFSPSPQCVALSNNSPASKEQGSEELFYVIENEYQQLVVSNIHGAVAEINLTVNEEKQGKGVIHQTQDDLLLQKKCPDRAIFPLHSHLTHQGFIEKGKHGGYYPLLRRHVAPQYYALAILDEDPSFPTIYRLNRLEKNLIELEGNTKQGKIIKTYSFPQDLSQTPYTFNLDITIGGEGRGLSLTTGVPEVELVSGNSNQALKYRMIRNQKGVVEQASLPDSVTTVASIYPDWIANSNGFFEIIIHPQSEMNPGFTTYQIPGAMVPSRLSFSQNQLYPAEKYPGYQMKLPFRSQGGNYHFRLFAGPLSTPILEQIDAVHQTDYSSTKSFHGWFAFISEPFAKFLFFLMKIFYSMVHSWGIAIILLTIALRVILYPLNAWSIKSTIKMKKLSPKLTQLQERYKKDPKKLQMEVMNLYREHGVSPLGGCLPLLIQMPFLIGMFDLLKSTFELRGASFIPGWIDDLAAPDVLFSWSTPIWFIGTSLHLLPILLGVVMFLQQRLSLPSKQPKTMSDQQKQQQMVGNLMTIIFTFLFYNFPSGLNIYWLSSMLLGILQQWWMAKYLKN